jgi:hypothetical protein
MCANDHDGTCTAILSRSKTQPNRLVAKLVCESCNEVVETLGFVEHTPTHAPTSISPHLKRAANRP